MCFLVSQLLLKEGGEYEKFRQFFLVIQNIGREINVLGGVGISFFEVISFIYIYSLVLERDDYEYVDYWELVDLYYVGRKLVVGSQVKI